MRRISSPVGAVLRGAIAATAGTAVMDLLLYSRYRRGGGTEGFLKWEFGGPDNWKSVSTPGQVGERLVEGFTQHPLSSQWARLTNTIVHWGFGISWGTVYGILAGSLRTPRILFGLPFGTGVWLFGYLVLPLGKLYKPIWKYSPQTLAKDLSAHLVYGITTAAVFRLLGLARILGR